MRTTIDIDDRLLREAKKRTAETHRTLTALIEDALRLVLRKTHTKAASRTVRIPTSGKGGVLPGVNLDDTSVLSDRIDGIK